MMHRMKLGKSKNKTTQIKNKKIMLKMGTFEIKKR